MSLHKSLKSSGALRRHRNVLTRAERLQKLLEAGKIDENRSVFGLPKVRNIKLKRRTTKQAKKEEALAAAAAEQEGDETDDSEEKKV